jgi:mono/diheme cytochrome c family protein
MIQRIGFFASAALLLATALTLLAQHNPSEVSSNSSEPVRNSTGADGERLFELHCAACHGPHGEGGKGPTLAQPKLPRATDDESLKDIIRQGIKGTEMPRARMERQEVAQVAAYVKSLARAHPSACRATRSAARRFMPARGSAPSVTSRAAREARSAPSSPTSAGVAALRTCGARSSNRRRRCRSTFSAHNEAGLPQNFLSVRVRTKTGDEFTGVRVNEDTFSILIRDATGKVRSFFRAELAELHKDWGKSPMPSYATAFTSDELDDLVAYLVSLREDK